MAVTGIAQANPNQIKSPIPMSANSLEQPSVPTQTLNLKGMDVMSDEAPVAAQAPQNIDIPEPTESLLASGGMTPEQIDAEAALILSGGQSPKIDYASLDKISEDFGKDEISGLHRAKIDLASGPEQEYEYLHKFLGEDNVRMKDFKVQYKRPDEGVDKFRSIDSEDFNSRDLIDVAMEVPFLGANMASAFIGGKVGGVAGAAMGGMAGAPSGPGTIVTGAGVGSVAGESAGVLAGSVVGAALASAARNQMFQMASGIEPSDPKGDALRAASIDALMQVAVPGVGALGTSGYRQGKYILSRAFEGLEKPTAELMAKALKQTENIASSLGIKFEQGKTMQGGQEYMSKAGTMIVDAKNAASAKHAGLIESVVPYVQKVMGTNKISGANVLDSLKSKLRGAGIPFDENGEPIFYVSQEVINRTKSLREGSRAALSEGQSLSSLINYGRESRYGSRSSLYSKGETLSEVSRDVKRLNPEITDFKLLGGDEKDFEILSEIYNGAKRRAESGMSAADLHRYIQGLRENFDYKNELGAPVKMNNKMQGLLKRYTSEMKEYRDNVFDAAIKSGPQDGEQELASKVFKDASRAFGVSKELDGLMETLGTHSEKIADAVLGGKNLEFTGKFIEYAKENSPEMLDTIKSAIFLDLMEKSAVKGVGGYSNGKALSAEIKKYGEASLSKWFGEESLNRLKGSAEVINRLQNIKGAYTGNFDESMNKALAGAGITSAFSAPLAFFGLGISRLIGSFGNNPDAMSYIVNNGLDKMLKSASSRAEREAVFRNASFLKDVLDISAVTSYGGKKLMYIPTKAVPVVKSLIIKHYGATQDNYDVDAFVERINKKVPLPLRKEK